MQALPFTFGVNAMVRHKLSLMPWSERESHLNVPVTRAIMGVLQMLKNALDMHTQISFTSCRASVSHR